MTQLTCKRRSSLTSVLSALFILFCTMPSHAGDMVQAVQAKYAAINDLKADFVQSTYVLVLDTTISESGVFYMKRPDLLRIEYHGSNPKSYISNGKKLLVEDALHTESFNVSDKTIPKEGLEFLNGFKKIEKLFVVSPWSPKKIVKGNIYFSLTPRNTGAQYKKLDCEFGGDYLLRTMVIHNSSGNISTYIFSNTKLNTGLGNDLFTIEPLKK